MNILQISRGIEKLPSENAGAIESVIVNLSKRMAKVGNNVVILDRKYSKEDQTIEYFGDIRIVRLAIQKMKFNLLTRISTFIANEINHLFFIFAVNKYINKHKSEFDVIHIHSDLMGAILIFLNKKLRPKIFYTNHSNIFSLDFNSLDMVRKINLKLDFYIMKRVKKVIVLTESIQSKCIKVGKVDPRDIVAIPNGVDTYLFNPTLDTEKIKQKYDLNEKITILFVGRIHRIKGVEYLIKAADIIINTFNYSDMLFLLVGPIEALGIDEPAYKEVINLIDTHQLNRNVKLTGSVPFDDLRRLYAACDICVLPSLAESFGLVITEAMASGTPVVATRTDGAIAQIEDGWNGLLIELANEIDLAEKIKLLIDNKDCRTKFGTNGRYLAEKKFDWETVAKKHLEFYSGGQSI